MKLLFYSILVSISFLAVISANEHVPVLLWSSSLTIPDVPSLRHIGTVGFNELVQDTLSPSKPMVVVFLEETLSTEDFNIRSHERKSIYEELETTVQDNRIKYFPSVVNPIKALRRLEEDGYDIFWYKGELPTDLKKPSVVIVSLSSDSMKDRSHVLRAHYKKIHRLYNELVHKHPDLLAVYTARFSPVIDADKVYSRVRRADDQSEDEPYEGLVIRNDNIAILATSIQYRTSDTSAFVNLTSVTGVQVTNNTNDNFLIVDVTFTPEILKFNFTANQELWHWELNSITIDNKELIPSVPISAPRSWSWFCAQNVSFSTSKLGSDANDPFLLLISGFQAQPFIDPATGEFGQAIDCVPYFSIAIWTGIIVVVLMLFILGWGLMMLMDINNNDRFDDPKGKTITISATD